MAGTVPFILQRLNCAGLYDEASSLMPRRLKMCVSVSLYVLMRTLLVKSTATRAAILLTKPSSFFLLSSLVFVGGFYRGCRSHVKNASKNIPKK